MARLQYDETTKTVKDVSPGRSMYLSNKQWAVLTKYLDQQLNGEEAILTGDDQSTLKGTLEKLLKIGKEVVNK